MRLVDRGGAQLNSDDYELAAATFRDAINVDSTNGVAYYYLAKANALLGESEAAVGILDKAEALLAGDEVWLRRVNGLRVEISSGDVGQGGGEKVIAPPPIDEAF